MTRQRWQCEKCLTVTDDEAIAEDMNQISDHIQAGRLREAALELLVVVAAAFDGVETDGESFWARPEEDRVGPNKKTVRGCGVDGCTFLFPRCEKHIAEHRTALRNGMPPSGRKA